VIPFTTCWTAIPLLATVWTLAAIAALTLPATEASTILPVVAAADWRAAYATGFGITPEIPEIPEFTAVPIFPPSI
jgi:hypothetical protein